MKFEIGSTIRWRTHPNYEGIVVDIEDDLYVVNIYRPRRFPMKLREFEIEVIPVDELNVELKEEDYKLLNEILLDISLLTRDKALFEECTKNK